MTIRNISKKTTLHKIDTHYAYRDFGAWYPLGWVMPIYRLFKGIKEMPRQGGLPCMFAATFKVTLIRLEASLNKHSNCDCVSSSFSILHKDPTGIIEVKKKKKDIMGVYSVIYVGCTMANCISSTSKDTFLQLRQPQQRQLCFLLTCQRPGYQI